ncbi:hypothetical protein B0H16DRAFT_1829545 [Mycena metata]|uniref:Uncharacterized protein n=1 Tax=Mycena metata TaxID=1033252 RepID=A0AAD7NXS6_9AGAR|nr:hypothetical protein B0H16DRAFT_1829545 [Mycena metata]
MTFREYTRIRGKIVFRTECAQKNERHSPIRASRCSRCLVAEFELGTKGSVNAISPDSAAHTDKDKKVAQFRYPPANARAIAESLHNAKGLLPGARHELCKHDAPFHMHDTVPSTGAKTPSAWSAQALCCPRPSPDARQQRRTLAEARWQKHARPPAIMKTYLPPASSRCESAHGCGAVRVQTKPRPLRIHLRQRRTRAEAGSPAIRKTHLLPASSRQESAHGCGGVRVQAKPRALRIHLRPHNLVAQKPLARSHHASPFFDRGRFGIDIEIHIHIGIDIDVDINIDIHPHRHHINGHDLRDGIIMPVAASRGSPEKDCLRGRSKEWNAPDEKKEKRCTELAVRGSKDSGDVVDDEEARMRQERKGSVAKPARARRTKNRCRLVLPSPLPREETHAPPPCRKATGWDLPYQKTDPFSEQSRRRDGLEERRRVEEALCGVGDNRDGEREEEGEEGRGRVNGCGTTPSTHAPPQPAQDPIQLLRSSTHFQRARSAITVPPRLERKNVARRRTIESAPRHSPFTVPRARPRGEEQHVSCRKPDVYGTRLQTCLPTSERATTTHAPWVHKRKKWCGGSKTSVACRAPRACGSASSLFCPKKHLRTRPPKSSLRLAPNVEGAKDKRTVSSFEGGDSD